MSLNIGLYGANGHQIYNQVKKCGDVRLVAICLPKDISKKLEDEHPGIAVCESLDQMLKIKELDLVSLCSASRKEQARDAIACLEAKKHVYAEKPAALSEDSLELILKTAQKNNVEFHEYVDTIYAEPYWKAREYVQSGIIGNVVQVYAQKSYPNRISSRPQDEETDGGLIRWVGVHAVRFIEHITGIWVDKISAFETRLSDPDLHKGMFTAASMAMTLQNGGVASVCLNYLNPKSFKSWGNECVRVFGDRGMLEICDAGARTHVYTQESDFDFDLSTSNCHDYFSLLVSHLDKGTPMPMSLEQELHPLRVVIRAKENSILSLPVAKIK